MNRLVFLIALLTGLNLASNAQTHFTPVWTGNGLDHMNIYVTYAAIDGVVLKEGDEIGVFDGTVCVGAAVRPTILGSYIHIVCSLDDPTTTGVTDGYTVGDSIMFKIWDKANGVEYSKLTAIYSTGPHLFTIGETAILTLDAESNKEPIAIVSPTKVIEENVEIVVDGAQSYDPNGDVLNYAWLVSPKIIGLDTTLASLTFTTPEVDANTLYNFTLTVTDGVFTSSASTSVLVVNVNKKPVIEGPFDKFIKEDSLLYLTIDSITFTDPDPAQTHKLTILPGTNYTLNNDTIRPLKNFNGAFDVPIIVSDGIDKSDVFYLLVQVDPVNDDPIFTSVPNLNAIKGKLYEYVINVYDADENSISIMGIGLPNWLNIVTDANGNKILAGIPPTTGDFAITIGASDGTVNISQNFTIKVVDQPEGIFLANLEIFPAKVGVNYDQKLRFASATPDSLIVSLGNKPQWLSLQNEVNGFVKIKMTSVDTVVYFTGTPPVGSVGTYPVEVKFRDTKVQRSKVFELRVIADNTPPVVPQINVSVNEDEKKLIVLQGTDNETPINLKFSIVEWPKHGELQLLSSKIFVYVPEKDFFGLDTIKFEVVELETTGLSTQSMVKITIDPVNDPPQISSWDQKFEVSENTPITIPGITLDDIIDGANASTVIAEKLFGPFNGTFDTNTFTYTPSTNYFGKDVVAIVAKEQDGEQLTSSPLLLFFNVIPTNQVPIVAADTVKLKEDHPITFIPRIFDREDSVSNLTIEFTALPQNGTITKNGIKLTYTPNENWFGTDSLNFSVIDPSGGLSNEIKVHIICSPINDYPIAQSNTIDAANATSLNLNFASLVSDIENSNLKVELVLWDSTANKGYSLFGSQITPTSDLEFTYTLGHNQGVDYIPYRVFDGQNTSTPGLLSLINLKTTKSIQNAKSSDTLIAVEDYIDITWGDTVNLVFTTVYQGSTQLTEAPELILMNEGELTGSIESPTVLSFTEGNPLITYMARYIAPNKSVKGTKARANDTAVLFDKVGYKTRRGQSKAFLDSSNVDTIYVGNLEKKVPTILANINDITMNEGQTAQTMIYFSDPDTPHDELEFSATSSVEGTNFAFTTIQEGQKQISITSPNNYFGTMTISVKVKDDTTQVYKQFIANVVAVNQAPSITTIDSTNYITNSPVTISALITDRETNEEGLTITTTAIPSNAVEQLIYNDGTITVQPAQNYSQDFVCKITVSDGTLSTEKEIKLQNRASNSLPEMDPISSISTNEDTPIDINVTPTDADLSDQLSFSFESNNAALAEATDFSTSPSAAVSGVSRTITFAPKSNSNGTVTVIAYVSDGIGQTAREFSVEVKPINDAPVVTALADQTMHNDETLSLNIEATDPDSYQFTYSASSSNANLQFTLVNNILNVKVLNDYRGNTTFTVKVQDDQQAYNEITVNLNVLQPTDIPNIANNVFTVYPNPTNEMINVFWKGENAQGSSVKLISITGQVILEKTLTMINHSKNEIFITEAPAGVYILQISTNNAIYNTRIIKK